MVLVDGQGTPLGIHVDSASPSETKLLDATLADVRVKRGRCNKPERLIAIGATTAILIRAKLAQMGIEPIIPAKCNNPRATHQDGRILRRFKRRWIIERTNAWLQNFRRLYVRYERSVAIFTGFIHMACALIALRRVLG